MAEWNSVDSLLEWRRAWAEIQNKYFDLYDIAAHVDHRSYDEQGIQLMPTIHEGKAVTAMERKYKKEYEMRMANGEEVAPRHTEIREFNMAIKEHNSEIILVAEIKRLINQLEKIIEPVKERIAIFENIVAERLERLRTEIINLGIKIKRQ